MSINDILFIAGVGVIAYGVRKLMDKMLGWDREVAHEK